ncbi:MAG: hypothetical protein JSV76_06385 [Candidatus Bathyarchaeota archaeon]|nr:MAG: hypothetical protein JSV76_06385 [Candidatus Bathyarchaeota archaeon]
MRKRYLVRSEGDEATVTAILDSIIQGIERTTHKITYRTQKGVVEYVSMPLQSNLGRYLDEGISTVLRKIILWNRDSTDVLEQLFRTDGMDIVEIVKDGPTTLELAN